MKLSERLDALHAQRKTIVTTMEGIFEKAEKDDRSFDETEQKQFDDAKLELGGLDRQILNVDELIKAQVVKGDPLKQDPKNPTSPIILAKRNLAPATAFIRYVCALALSKGSLHQALEISKQWRDSTPEVETVIKAAVAAGTTTDPTWAKPLVEYANMTSEFIELLRPQTFLGRMQGMRNVPFNIRIPRQTAGSTVGWVGEGLSKPVSKLAFDAVTFPWAKVAGIIVITEELARFSSPAAEGLVRQDMIDEIAQFLDKWFCSGIPAVPGTSPGGIFTGRPQIPVGAGGVITVADITAALGTAITNMTSAGIPMRSPYWLMHSSTAMKLGLLRTSQDVFAFREEMASGKLLGIPVLSSANMPINDVADPDPDTTTISLVDASQILFADDGPVVIDVSREASLQLDSAPGTPPVNLVSLWQQNMLGIKAEIYRYWMRRRDDAVQVIGPVVL
jgi:HK97 family phage major capsid protein